MRGSESIDVESASEQNTVIPVPEKRKKRARCVSIILCTITAILLVAFCVVNRNVDEYYRGPTQKNTTNICYRKEEKLTFSGLFTTALGLFGVVLGTLVDRLSLIAEERHHRKQRYDGSRKKMIKACFSGISWGPVIALLGLAAIILVILIFVTGKPWLELSYLVYIFSGIGVGPLVMHLLSLNTQSEVHISTILEEKETYVANGLAWSYYFNYLDIALPKFNEIILNNSCNSVELKDGKVVKLSSSKLILLLSHDCTTADNLAELDDKIIKQGEISNDNYIFPVYQLTYNNRAYTYVIIYVMQPLETLEKMSQYGRIKALDGKQLEYQVKLLCRTLSEILQKPFNKECKEKCILVAMKANSKESLNNGGLVNVIMQEVQAVESGTLEHVDGFVQVPPCQKTKQPKTIKDNTRNKSKKSDIKLQLIKNIEENIDTPCTDQRKASKVSQQEVGDGNGASTSGTNLEMVVIANQQSKQQDDHSSNTTHDQTNTAAL
ncbi:Stimulator of interferon genes [Paramuricea clavata]|uniref:Stimulator of interferon genes n=1 Tax=Paramuricea clavata TaxID=317549 RepID=A0A6S7HZ06_PARCT|nr:Stimulator of interferon genes [Paramuricea clavata]